MWFDLDGQVGAMRVAQPDAIGNVDVGQGVSAGNRAGAGGDEDGDARDGRPGRRGGGGDGGGGGSYCASAPTGMMLGANELRRGDFTREYRRARPGMRIRSRSPVHTIG